MCWTQADVTLPVNVSGSSASFAPQWLSWGGMGREGQWDWGVLTCPKPGAALLKCTARPPAVKSAFCPSENLPVRTLNYFFKAGKKPQTTDLLSTYIIYFFFLTALPIHKIRQKEAKYLPFPWGLTSQRNP